MSGLMGEGAWNTGDPPGRRVRRFQGLPWVCGAGTALPGWASRTNGSGPGAPEPGEAAAAAFASLELDPSLCSADALAALRPAAP